MFSKQTILLLGAGVLLLAVVAAAASSPAPHTKWHQLQGYTFDKYRKEFSKVYDHHEYLLRKSIFEERLASIMAHNSDPTKTWKQGVNHLTDRTDGEMNVLYGYIPSMNKQSKGTPLAASPINVKDLPTEVDWRTKGVVTAVKDQGMCGSCWAFGAVESLESMHAIATGQLTVLSEQQVLDCTPNPEECGGTGGCRGGTAELAYDKLKEIGGLSTEWTYPYISYFGKDFPCQKNSSNFRPKVKISDYVVLPENKQDPILEAVATKGPLVISVDASRWSTYESGVFDGCNQNQPDINHAVLLVGYGEDSQHGPYWLVRNSWSPTWGDAGYIKLRREKESEIRCGIDITPEHGTGCKGGPPTVKVCGTCGILYDVCYPIVAL